MNKKKQRKIYGAAFGRWMTRRRVSVSPSDPWFDDLKEKMWVRVLGVSHDAYIAWRRLTNNGRRTREQMSPESQAEYDTWGFKQVPPPTPEEQAEAKRLYEEATRRSVPESSASTS